jgi:hypothetical protein
MALSRPPIAMPLLGTFCEFIKSDGVTPISGGVAHFCWFARPDARPSRIIDFILM